MQLPVTQAAYSVTDDADVAVTSIKAAGATLLDARKLEEIAKLGVQDAATRPTVEVLREIVERTAHAPELLTPIFDQTARDLAKVFQNRAALDAYENVMAGTEDTDAASDQLDRDAARLADTTKARVEAATDVIASAFGRFSDAIGLRSISAAALAHLPELATLAGAGWLGYKGARGIGRWWNRPGAGGAFGRAAGRRGAGMAGAGSIAPASVQRMTVGTLVARRVAGGGGWVGGRGERSGRRGGRVAGRGMLGAAARGVRGGASRLPVVGALVSGGMILGELRDGDMAGVLRESGTAFGAAAGGMIGASVGSVVPVLGTTLGGLIGTVLGGAAGGSLMDAAAGLVGEREDTPSERRRRRGREGKRRADAAVGGAEPAAGAEEDAAPRRSVRRNVRETDAPAGAGDDIAAADRPGRRSARADVRARDLAVARSTQVVHNDNRRSNITVNAPPGADAQEIAELVAEQVRAELKRRDQEREDYLDTVLAPRNALVSRH